jgi:predicted secreted Zn-dependent protease
MKPFLNYCVTCIVSWENQFNKRNMKKIILLTALLSLSGWAHAALKPGDSLSPYEIKNVATGQQYCQVCAYGTKMGKVVAFGKLADESFWSDLKKLQALQDSYKNLGVFAQVIDSQDTKAIKEAAEKHGIKFPVVVAVKKDWDKAYHVQGVSRTIYYAQQNNKIVWTATGLNERASDDLSSRVKKDLAS